MLHEVAVFDKGEFMKPFEQRADVQTLVARIQSDKYEPQTSHRRTLVDDRQACEYERNQFYGVRWSSSCAASSDTDGLQTHSGLICVGIVNLSAERLQSLRSLLTDDEYSHVIFTAASGTGLNVVIKIDNQDPNDHQAFFRQITDYYRDVYHVQEEEIDQQGQGADWRCILAHDPDAFCCPTSSTMPLTEAYQNAPQADQISPEPKTATGSLIDEVKAERENAERKADESTGNGKGDSSGTDEPQHVGLFTLRTANGWIEEAKTKPIPKMLFDEFWLEGEICFMFAEANQGKSILAVQVCDSVSRGEPIKGFRMEARAQPVICLDFELSAKQFEARYSQNFRHHYRWHSNFKRIEINPDADVPAGYSFEDYLNESMEEAIKQTGAKVLIVDNITYLRSDTESAKDAGPLMKYLKALKQKHGLSLLILAHCPKRDASRPLTRNDLQGSARLNQFADSMIAIGASAKDSQLKYLKQVKVRSTAYKYDSDNVAVCQIHQPGSFLMLEFLRFSTEQEHLKQPTEKDTSDLPRRVSELRDQKKTQKQIADELGISQPKVSRILTKLDANK